MSDGGLQNPKLTLKVNGLWIKMKRQNFASQVLSRHTFRISRKKGSDFFDQNNLLSKHQSGFCAVHSTVTALLEATDSWALNIDRGLINAIVYMYLDLKQVFDTLDHEILLFRLC